MDDLYAQGYRNFERTEPISLKTCRKIMRVFARLHSISFAFKHVEPQQFELLAGAAELKETLFSEEIPDSFVEFLRNKVGLAITVMQSVEAAEGDARVYERLHWFRDNIATSMRSACDKGVVFCHGDPWISNWLYKVCLIICRLERGESVSVINGVSLQ